MTQLYFDPLPPSSKTKELASRFSKPLALYTTFIVLEYQSQSISPGFLSASSSSSRTSCCCTHQNAADFALDGVAPRVSNLYAIFLIIRPRLQITGAHP